MTRSHAARALAALCLVAALAFVGASPASAQCYFDCPPEAGTPTFTIDDSTVVPGQTVGVSGTGCAPNSIVEFSIGETIVGSTQADASGNYSGSVTIPDLAPGEYTLTATCDANVLGLTISVGSVGGSGGGVGGVTTGPVARTGSDLAPLAVLGAAALVLGAAAVYGTRSRRQEI